MLSKVLGPDAPSNTWTPAPVNVSVQTAGLGSCLPFWTSTVSAPESEIVRRGDAFLGVRADHRDDGIDGYVALSVDVVDDVQRIAAEDRIAGVCKRDDKRSGGSV